MGNNFKPILIISAGRRFHYLETTISSLAKNIPNIENTFKKVWLLDDRSPLDERVLMDSLMKRHFKDKYQLIYFNSNEPFAFVDKFNIIKKLSNEDDIVFFLEDDWELNQSFNIQYYTDVLRNSDYTQLSFTDPFWLQEPSIQEKYSISNEFWKNPWPNQFKHPIKWFEGQCHWVQGAMNNYTNNPNLAKGEIYHRVNFKNIKNFEWEFAQELNGNHIFHKKCYFNHIGTDSLIDKL